MKNTEEKFLTLEQFMNCEQSHSSRFGIKKCFMHDREHICLTPSLPLTSEFMHHKASVGILSTHYWRIPIGVEAYILSSKDKVNLSEASRITLTLLSLKIAWVSPFFVQKHFYYNIKQALLVTFVIGLIQPLYEIDWQSKRLFLKLFS